MQSIVSLESENRTLNKQLKEKTDALHEKIQELKAAEAQRKDYKGRLEQTDREAHQQRDKMTAKYKELNGEFKKLTKENKRLEEEVEATLVTADQSAREHWRGEFEKLTKANEGLKGELEESKKENKRLEEEVEATLATADQSAREHWRKTDGAELKKMEKELKKVKAKNEKMEKELKKVKVKNEKILAAWDEKLELAEEIAQRKHAAAVTACEEENRRLQATIQAMGALGDKARAVVHGRDSASSASSSSGGPSSSPPVGSADSKRRKKKKTRRRRREGRK